MPPCEEPSTGQRTRPGAVDANDCAAPGPQRGVVLVSTRTPDGTDMSPAITPTAAVAFDVADSSSARAVVVSTSRSQDRIIEAGASIASALWAAMLGEHGIDGGLTVTPR
jgi:hypothetical protein